LTAFSADAMVKEVGRSSSVVEQSIRNRQVVGSTPTFGSIVFWSGPEHG
jgi:hypothetical protein